MTISFEFFPPKTAEGMANLKGTAAALADVQPEFFSVTFGAGGSTREGTIDTVKMLQQATSLPVAPHLSCINGTRDDIIAILHLYKKVGVKRIVVLRGDAKPQGELHFASDLVRLIREETADYFHIEVAAYPEVHPEAAHALQDALYFKQKIEAGANSAITQYFFNPEAYFYFLDYCAKLNIFVPITPGIMPIVHFDKLLRFSEMCSADIPRWIRQRVASYGDDQVSIQAFGLEVVYDLCQRLLAGGAPGLHFYTLNQADTSLRLLKMLNVTPFSFA